MAKNVAAMNKKYVESLRKQRDVATQNLEATDKALQEADKLANAASVVAGKAYSKHHAAQRELAMIDDTLAALGTTK